MSWSGWSNTDKAPGILIREDAVKEREQAFQEKARHEHEVLEAKRARGRRSWWARLVRR